jgi:hypothetical protein
MIDPSPSVLTLKADLLRAVQTDRRRRRRRRRALRSATVAVLAMLAASATAIGAGAALGVIHLGDGASARRISHVPKLGAFTAFCRSECSGATRFVYRVTPELVQRTYNVQPNEVLRAGGGMGCLRTLRDLPPYEPHEIYVGSRHRLTPVDLESITGVARGRPGARLPRGAWLMLQSCPLQRLHPRQKSIR